MKADIVKLRQDIQSVLDAHGVKGFTLKVGNAKYSDTEVTFQLTAVKIGATPQIALDFTHYAASYGLNPDLLGKTFDYAGKAYTIDGLEIRRPKNNIKATGPDGKVYLFPHLLVKQLTK